MSRRASLEERLAVSYRLSLQSKPRRVPVGERFAAYLTAIFAKGTRYYTLNFDRLARSFSCTRRTVENVVAKERKAGRFCFNTIRAGSSYAVQVSGRNCNTKKFGFLPKPKKENSNTDAGRPVFKKSLTGWVPKPPPRKILALAAFLARHMLGKLHRANSRTMFRFAHAFSFAADALHAGFHRDDIADAYRHALRNVDDDLAHLPPETRWEPSSLVRLARSRLADGMDIAERVRLRAAALRCARGGNAAPAVAFGIAPAPSAPTETETSAFFGEIMAQHAAAPAPTRF